MSKADFFELPHGDKWADCSEEDRARYWLGEHRECIEVELTDIQVAYLAGQSDERKRWEAKTCRSCKHIDDIVCNHQGIPEYHAPQYIKFSGCGYHEPKGSE